MSPLVALVFLLLSVTIAEEKRGIFDEYLQYFDIECLNSIRNDPAAVDALHRLEELDVQNPNIDPNVLVDFEALGLSDHLVCSTQSSYLCNDVSALPSRGTSEELSQLIATEFQGKSDDQILGAFKYDIPGLCSTLAQLDAALTPHKDCISRNLEALGGLPSAVRAAVLELLKENTGGSASPLDFNLTAVLELSDSCEDFKVEVVSSLRSSMTASFWNTLLLSFMTNYDLDGFNHLIEADMDIDFQYSYGCTIPKELICTKLKGAFSSACQLNKENDFNFAFTIETDDGYLDSYRSYAQLNSGDYPCWGTFEHACYGKYLDQTPSIPDLMLEMTCREPGYYFSISGDADGSDGSDDGNDDDDDDYDDGSDGGSDDGSGDGSGDGSDDGSDDGSGDGSDGGSNGGPDGVPSGSSTAGLSAGGIAAVTLGVIGAVSAAAVVVGLLLLKRKKTEANPYQVQLE